ncbi:MAG: PEP-CTERM sorting domain-containing protein [Candidatus Korobacteraceae bacterium]
MKVFVGLLCLAMLAIPAVAANVYDNGPVNGQVDAWTINFGFELADSFVVPSNNQLPINGIDFWVWLIPGDSITNVQVQLGTMPFSNEFFDGFVSLTQSGCFANSYGYNVCMESGSFAPVNLSPGNYWLTLQNANVPSGDPVYWDENSGVGCQSQGCPSQATNGAIGTIPSEAFTLSGSSTTTTTGTTPEPGSILLFGSGVLGLAGILLRKRL